MSYLPQIHTKPFRFLLYFEWILLAISAVARVLPTLYFLPHPYLPIQPLLVIALFGCMGLVLPNGRHLYKVSYTGIEVSLLSWGASLGLVGVLPILYLIVVIRSCFYFEFAGRLMVVGLVFTIYCVNLMQQLQHNALKMLPTDLENYELNLLPSLLATVLPFFIGLLLVLLLMNTAQVAHKTQAQLATANAKLQQYALQVEQLVTLQERNRIARDIHDSLGHSLTAINVQLQSAIKLRQTSPERAWDFIVGAKQLGSTALQDVRQSISTLRSDLLKGRSLEGVMESLMEGFYQATGVMPVLRLSLAAPLPAVVVTTLYRIVQESLTNICKHAQATDVQIQVIATTAQVYLIIQDNGKGFQSEEESAGFGIQGMRERVRDLKGQFTISSQPSAGCHIMVELPLEKVSG